MPVFYYSPQCLSKRTLRIFFEAGTVVHIPASARAFHCNLFAALSGHGQKGFPLQSRLFLGGGAGVGSGNNKHLPKPPNNETNAVVGANKYSPKPPNYGTNDNVGANNYSPKNPNNSEFPNFPKGRIFIRPNTNY